MNHLSSNLLTPFLSLASPYKTNFVFENSQKELFYPINCPIILSFRFFFETKNCKNMLLLEAF
ncbi:hypothetical protein DU18_0467 [Chlamydia muridarum]|nr:hypothetical protein DU18_0467 [Chlamydia muridarum]